MHAVKVDCRLVISFLNCVALPDLADNIVSYRVWTALCIDTVHIVAMRGATRRAHIVDKIADDG